MPEFETILPKKELLTEQPYLLPADESFYMSQDSQRELWPEEVVENSQFIEQSKERSEQIEHIEKLIAALSSTPVNVEQLVSQDKIALENLTKAYVDLSNILENPDYRRLSLYLPFEILPEKGWKPEDPALEKSLNAFTESYMNAWRNLLTVHDVRANFIDCDILEADQASGEFPRVVKGIHLVPLLLAKGLLTVSELTDIFQKHRNPLLQENIRDIIPLLIENKLLSHEEASVFGPLDQSAEVSLNTEKKSLSEILESYQNEISNAKEDAAGITEKRRSWLIKQQKKNAREKASDDISRLIINEDLPAENLFAMVSEKDLAVESLRKALINQKSENFEFVRELYDKNRSTILELWNAQNPETSESLKKLFYHLYRKGLINTEEMKNLGLTIPRFEGRYSDNLPLLENDLQALSHFRQELKSNPELSSLIYPVFLVYGSRLKGYGESTSDIDIAVFIRPGVNPTQKNQISSLLQSAIEHPLIQDHPVQFWLEENGNDLQVKDFEEYEAGLGESYWAHILFGSAWQGDKEQILELRKRLLPGYLKDGGKKIFGKNARRMYLEEIERDALQYRLLHSGYEKFSPISPALESAYANSVDAKSAFWDSGYRQAATRIYLKKVFLPNLSE